MRYRAAIAAGLPAQHQMAVASNLGLALQTREVASLLDRFDVDKDGQVDYRDFCRFASPSAANLSDEERVMRQRIREAAFARGGLSERFDDPDLRRAFHLDAFGNRKINIMAKAQRQLERLALHLRSIADTLKLQLAVKA